MTDTMDGSSARAGYVVLVAALALFASSAPAGAGTAVNTGYFGDVAIEGYDPVAYFTDGRATQGSEEFAYDWLGATWYFANAEHRDLFAAQPVQYAPQYGGHCALGTAFGESTANIDPEAWAIVEGKLYLQYSKGARGMSGNGIVRTGSRRPTRNGRRSKLDWRTNPAASRAPFFEVLSTAPMGQSGAWRAVA
jgi:YHS domain-containing protein